MRLQRAVLLLLVSVVLSLPAHSQPGKANRSRSKSQVTRHKTVPVRDFSDLSKPYLSPSRKYALVVTYTTVRMAVGIAVDPVFSICRRGSKPGKGDRSENWKPVCQVGTDIDALGVWLPGHLDRFVFSRDNTLYLWSRKHPSAYRKVLEVPRRKAPNPDVTFGTGAAGKIILRGASSDGRTVHYSYIPLTQRSREVTSPQLDVTPYIVWEDIPGKEEQRSLRIRN